MLKFAVLIAIGLLTMVGGAFGVPGGRQHATSGGPTNGVTPIAAGEGVWESLKARPLVLPSLAAGEACPVTRTTEVLPGQKLPGDGPIYPHFPTDEGALRYGGAQQDGDWYYVKVLWRASGDYGGPALIRGRQLDGAQELRFGHGPTPSPELRFPVETGVRSGYTVDGWRDNPSYTRIKTPGCYAWQVDGLNFRTVIVFKAEP